MKRSQALAALDEAANVHFSELFRVLIVGLQGGVSASEEATKRFERGFTMLLKAHMLAQNLIERTIPADKLTPAPY